MNIMKFMTKNSSLSTLHAAYKVKYAAEEVNTIFLGLKTENHLNWKNHIEQMIPKLGEACYTGRPMVHISNINTLRSICAYLESITKTRNNFLC